MTENDCLLLARDGAVYDCDQNSQLPRSVDVSLHRVLIICDEQNRNE